MISQGSIMWSSKASLTDVDSGSLAVNIQQLVAGQGYVSSIWFLPKERDIGPIQSIDGVTCFTAYLLRQRYK